MESQVLDSRPNPHVVELGYSPNLYGFKGTTVVRSSERNSPSTCKDSARDTTPNKHITQTVVTAIRAQNCPPHQWC